MFVFNSVLKELDNTTQSKSNVTARWIVVKVSNLNNDFTYIYFMFVFSQSVEMFEYINFIMSLV